MKPNASANDEGSAEPLYTTLLRTVGIAIVVGVVAARLGRGFITWPAAALLALWPSFGGHWVERAYLSWIRPSLPSAAGVRMATRVAVWLLAGALFALLIRVTSRLLPLTPEVRLPLLVGALGFVAIELVAHLGLQLRGQASFYNGRG